MATDAPGTIGPFEVTGRAVIPASEQPPGIGVFHARRAGEPYLVHRIARPATVPQASLARFVQLGAEGEGLPRLAEVVVEPNHIGLAFRAAEGVSLARIFAHLQLSEERVPDPVAWYVAHVVARTLARCHAAKDQDGRPASAFHGALAAESVFVTWGGEVLVQGLCPLVGGLEFPGERPVRPSTAWLAPEVRRGGEGSPRADAYGVTQLLRAMLTGEERPTPQSEAMPLAALRPDLPQELCGALDRGLASSPSTRSTCAELARWLSTRSPGDAGRLGLLTLIEPFETLGALWSTRGARPSPAADDGALTVVHDPPTFSDSDSTMIVEAPALPASPPVAAPPPKGPSPERGPALPAKPGRLPSPPPVLGLAPRPSADSTVKTAAVVGSAADTELIDLDSEAVELEDAGLDGTLVIDPDAARLPVALPRAELAPPPARAPSPSVAPPPQFGMMTVIDDGAPDPSPGQAAPSHAPVGWLGGPRASLPSIPPAPPKVGGRDVYTTMPSATNAMAEAQARLAAEAARKVEILLDGALVASEATAPAAGLPSPAPSSPPIAGAASSEHPPTIASPAPASADAQAAFPKRPRRDEPTVTTRGRRRRSVVPWLVALGVVWGIAAAVVYVRLRGNPFLADATPEPPVAVAPQPTNAASVVPASAPPAPAATALPSSSSESPATEPVAAPSATAAPTSSGAAEPVATASASSTPGEPQASAAPAAEPGRAPSDTETYLTAKSSIDAGVYSDEKLVGPTNQRLVAPCGWHSLRLGFEPGPFWLNQPRRIYIPCKQPYILFLVPNPLRVYMARNLKK